MCTAASSVTASFKAVNAGHMLYHMQPLARGYCSRPFVSWLLCDRPVCCNDQGSAAWGAARAQLASRIVHANAYLCTGCRRRLCPGA